MKLVHSLQQKALDSTISVTALLRFAYAIAVKLNLADFQKWLYSELESLSQSEYELSKELSFSTQLKFAKIFCGLKPVIIIGSQQIIGILDTVRNRIQT